VGVHPLDVVAERGLPAFERVPDDEVGRLRVACAVEPPDRKRGGAVQLRGLGAVAGVTPPEVGDLVVRDRPSPPAAGVVVAFLRERCAGSGTERVGSDRGSHW
jgi:hypothetical protein